LSIAEARRRCLDIVLINGEDLTPYRAANVSAPDGQIVRTIAREVNAISVLIPKICKSVIKLLCFLSEGGSQEVSRFLLNKNKLQLFVSFLEDDSKGDVQAATTGILANLPASDSKLTTVLIEYEALPTIIKVIVAH
jgi:hypothetical protein